MRNSGVLVNTFENMECVYIDHLKKQVGHDRVWAIGPSLDGKHGSMNECYDGSTPLTLDDVMKWLDKKPYESVVFICFGTRAALTKQEMIALLNALKHSVVDFILCVKPQNSINIPYGFEEIVNDRGLIIRDWIPQFEILAHPAVGSFLNSCGWNSILEGVKAGVMMLAWPMGSDQFANAKLLVDELGVGKHVCAGGHTSVPDSMEFATLLHDSVDGDTPERVKVKEFATLLHDSVDGN
ncbi:UDP-glycosyltransferase 89B2-like protein [Tanacetum coccineum]